MENISNMDLLKDSQIDIMSTLYLSGKTLKEVGKHIGRSRHYVTPRLLKAGIILKLPGGVLKYSCNEDYFEIIDSEGKAYWLGFIAADGCVRDNFNRITLCLAIKDIEILEKFKKVLNSDHPINIFYGGKVCRLIINSAKMKKDLIDKGVVPCKSLILEPPKNVPEDLIHHWIRGLFDGDGSISFRFKNKHKRVGITSTKEVLEFIQKILGIGYIHKCYKAKAFTYRVGTQVDVKKFANYIYKDADTYLERKWLRFQT